MDKSKATHIVGELIRLVTAANEIQIARDRYIATTIHSETRVALLRESERLEVAISRTRDTLINALSETKTDIPRSLMSSSRMHAVVVNTEGFKRFDDLVLYRDLFSVEAPSPAIFQTKKEADEYNEGAGERVVAIDISIVEEG